MAEELYFTKLAWAEKFQVVACFSFLSRRFDLCRFKNLIIQVIVLTELSSQRRVTREVRQVFAWKKAAAYKYTVITGIELSTLLL